MRFYQILLGIIFFSFFSGCAPQISMMSGVDDTLPPPQNIKMLVDVGSVGFEWDIVNHPNVRGFAVYRSTNNKEFREIAHIDSPIATHFVDSKLVPESKYQYYFYTLGVDSYSKRSEILRIQTSFIDSVENLFASNDYPKKVKLLWTPHANPSVAEYLLQREIDGEFKTIATIKNRLLVEYVDDDLKDGAEYKYRVIAMDFLGNPSRPSGIVTATTKAKPSSASDLSATTHLPKKIVVSWQPIAEAKYYKIYRSNTQNGRFILISKSDKLNFTDNVGSPNVGYYYKISAVDSTEIESDLSKSVRGATRNLPQKPVLTKGYVDKQSVQIAWEADMEAAYFFVNRKKGAFGRVEKFRVNGNSFSDVDVKVGDEYTYYITAIDEFGLESSPSQEVSLSIR